MRLSKFLGRILIAILFVNAGISQYVNQDSFIHYFNIRYPLYHKFASNLLGSTLDQIEILNPNNLIKITPYLILGSGILQILLGLCVGIGIQKAGYALALLTAIITIYAHNPLIYSKKEDVQREYIQIIFNVGIIGGLLLIQNKKRNSLKNTNAKTQQLKDQTQDESLKKQNSEKINQENSNQEKEKAH